MAAWTPKAYLGRKYLVQQRTLLGMLQSHGLSRGLVVEVQTSKLQQRILDLRDLWSLLRILHQAILRSAGVDSVLATIIM